MKDFYVSYHPADEEFAAWLAGQLEEAGYSTILAAWDFRPGNNLVVAVHGALKQAARVLAVLSEDYVLEEWAQAEWAAAFGQDPSGQKRLLVPILYRRCIPTGLLAQLRAIDVVGRDEQTALHLLLEGLRPEGPPRRAPFPGPRTGVARPLFPGDLRTLRDRLPLPLAQLLQRTLTGKSPADRHLNAYYLAEATLKLTAALRIGLWLDRAFVPGSELARKLEALVRPEPDHWYAALCDVDTALSERQDAALLPLGAELGRLSETRSRFSGAAALAQAALSEGVADGGPWDGAPPQSARTFFALVLSYRSRIITAAPRRPEFCERFTELWLKALADVLAAPVLFGGLRLLHAQLSADTAGAQLAWSWQDLTGPINGPLTDPVLPVRDDIEPGGLYFGGPGSLVPLSPLVAYREDDLSRGAVGILHYTHRRTRREGQRAVEEIIGADYLDYFTGENLRGIDPAEALAGFLHKLRGEPATVEDVRRAQERSVDATRALPEAEEIVSADAALGDYELLGEIGRGGMGIVYKARQRSLRRIVALKILPPALAANAARAQRFRREAAALGRCAHPQVVGILGSGMDRDRAYFAMEFIDGADLATIGQKLAAWQCAKATLSEGHLVAAAEAATAAPAEEAALPEPSGRPLALRLAELFADAALGLAHIHQQGVIHRDLKPSNVMLTRDGRRIVIADLGLARLLDGSQSLTQNQMHQVGTLRYMAPELLAGKSADIRSDVYGLGCALYELLAGQPLYDGETETRMRQQILTDAPPPLGRLSPHLPRDLVTVVEVALSREPDDRYQSAQALADDLRAVGEQRPIAARPPGRLHRLRLYVRREPQVALLLALVSLLPLLGSLSYWQWTRESVRYYTTYVEHNGIWEGVGEVSFLTQRHRNTTYRFVRQRGRLVRVEHINGLGYTRDDDEREAVWKFEYAADSERIVQIVSFDRRGYLQRRRVYSADLKRLEYRDEFDNPKPKKSSDVSLELRELNARGYVTRERLANLYGDPRVDAEGGFSYGSTRNSQGLLERLSVLDEKGQPSAIKDGVATVRNRLDSWGNEVEVSFFGIDDKPILRNGDVARWQSRFDPYGNEVERRFFDTRGMPSLSQDRIGQSKSRFDERGNEIERTFFGQDGHPTLDKDGTAGWRCRFDERGNPVELAFLGLDGQPTLNKDGLAGWRYKFDERGNEIERSYFGTDGNPKVDQSGVAGWKVQFDGRGNAIGLSYMGPDGKPALNKDGIAGWRTRFDDRDKKIELTYLGTRGEVIRNKDSVAGWRSVFDERGHEIRRAFFDVSGRPALHKDGEAGWKARFDDHGNEIENSYIGADGQPTLTKEGFAGWRSSVDSRGQETERRYFDVKGNPTLIDDGYAGYRKTFDERGHEIELVRLGIDGQRTLGKDGAASWKARFDERGHEIERAYFGVDGKPRVIDEGYASWKAKFDEHGNRTELAHLDVNGGPSLHQDGYATVKYRFDERGYEIERAYFGVDGKPSLHKDGYATVKYRFDERGHNIEHAYFGVDGKPSLGKDGFAGWRSKFDERSNEIEHAYFDVDGKLKRDKMGVASWRSKVNERGQAVEFAFFGPDDQLVLNDDGVAGYKATFDERGNRVEVAFFGTDRKPVFAKGGWAGSKARFDDWGHEIEMVSVGLDGQPVMTIYGFAGWKARFDARGNELEKQFYNAHGQPAAVDDGAARHVFEYNDRGQLIAGAGFGPDDKPVMTKMGWAGVLVEPGPRDTHTSELTMNAQGVPIYGNLRDCYWRLNKGRLALDWTPNCSQSVVRPRVEVEQTIQSYILHTTTRRMRLLYPQEFQKSRGLLVTEIQPNSPVARIDLRVGDLILDYNAQPLRTKQELAQVMINSAEKKPSLRIFREGRSLTIPLQPGVLVGAALEEQDGQETASP